eukprot:SAG11_NODE_4844_length_1749_cov_1.223030_1_plen_94_part_00
MGEIALLLQLRRPPPAGPPPPPPPPLSAADGAKMVAIMRRADWEGGGTVSKPKWTGANLLDMLRIQLHRGLFTNNATLVRRAQRVPRLALGEA